jgi:hypothetical protein
MKKIVSTSLLISSILTGSNIANDASPVFNGLYLGGGLVYCSEKIKTNANYNNNGRTGQVNQTDAFRGLGIKLFTGYGIFVYQNIYAGAEVGLGIDRVIGSNKSSVIESGNNVNYNIAARLGYGIANVLPYVKFGYEGRPTTKVFNVANINRGGYIFGGGIDISMFINVFGRIEYIHGFGAKTKFNGSNTWFGSPLSASGKTKTKSDALLIGAAYKF